MMSYCRYRTSTVCLAAGIARRPRPPIEPTNAKRHHADHSHVHHHDQLTPGWSSPAQRVTLLGLFSNVTLTGGKLWAGLYYGSAALVADGFHSASDMLSDFVTLAALRFAAGPPSARFPGPDGLLKVEPLGALAVSGLLLGGGISVGWSSMVRLASVLGYDLGEHTHDHGAALLQHAEQLPAAVFGLAAGVVVVKELLYQATMVVARRENSTLLRAQAWHHRSDALSTLIAVVAVGGSAAGYPALDPAGGLLVSTFVARAGLATLRSSVYSLLDANDPELDVLVTRVVKGIIPSASSMRARRQRKTTLVEMNVTLPPHITIEFAQRQIERWQSDISKHLNAPVKLHVRVGALHYTTT